MADLVKSLPMWGEWIEIAPFGVLLWFVVVSLPMWGEWIEIPADACRLASQSVSPHVGRVD